VLTSYLSSMHENFKVIEIKNRQKQNQEVKLVYFETATIINAKLRINENFDSHWDLK